MDITIGIRNTHYKIDIMTSFDDFLCGSMANPDLVINLITSGTGTSSEVTKRLNSILFNTVVSCCKRMLRLIHISPEKCRRLLRGPILPSNPAWKLENYQTLEALIGKDPVDAMESFKTLVNVCGEKCGLLYNIIRSLNWVDSEILSPRMTYGSQEF